MVQRGYFTSISVLPAALPPSFLRLFPSVSWYCRLRTPLPSRLLLLFVSLSLVTRRPHPAALLTDQPQLRPGIGLAFGGGFARGYAHLGVLQVFEEENIPIACIAGTSIGSILGAAYASKLPLARIIEKCREIRFRDFGRWRVSRFGLASNDRIGALVHRFFDSRQFEDLSIPTVIVATDLDTGDPVLFKQGNLAEPIRASCSFPSLFEPVQIGTRYWPMAASSPRCPLVPRVN